MKSSAQNLIISERIAKAVNESGGRVFYVGGYVRDKISGRNSKDIDIEIHGVTPEKLREILCTFGDVQDMGASFSIMGLKHYRVDISMPRSLITGEIDPFTGYVDAARRRDFTMNALMEDVLTGEILDFYGGIDDINRRIIRHVDDSTFLLDPLRVIRAARFSAGLGFDVDDDTRRICSSTDISKIAPERVFSELERAITKSKSPSRFFTELERMNQLSVWFPEVREYDIIDMAANVREKSSYITGFMLSSLCHDMREDDITRFLSRLTNDIRLTKYVLNMAGLSQKLSRMPEDSPVLSLLEVFDDAECPDDLALLSEIFTGNPHSDILTLYHERMRLPSVRGADILREGASPGPAVG
ncbi:MAG: CCA tRNA nucleotidyltransferase, partial [Synergistaceae bacterium]|nr:CCA tRNA nucleotidyltransferase [Synergistaceae bacterium]